MKATLRKYRFPLPRCHAAALLTCALVVFGLPADAQPVHLSTTNVQGSSATAGWNATIWKTNSAGDVNLGGTSLVGPGVAPAAGNTYSCVSNGIVFSANSQNTIIRNPFIAGQAAVQTFPGDSLTLYPDTEIRFKRIASGNVPICNFPGVGGNPGLILKGGFLNGGDDELYPVTGRIRVDAQSYFAMGNNGGQAPTSTGRRFNVSAEITGSGNLVFFNAGGNVSQIISGRNDTYTGQWILKSAWVQFTGINSLGTNSSILVDPLYTLPLDPGIVDVQGPADFEPTYDVNSAGTLTLANNGRMRLHQNCAFTAVTINGTPLSAGKHSYASLVAAYPSNFAPGGSGSITVQPYGQLPVVFLTGPQPQSLYPGRTARFAAVAAGPGTVSYQWFKDNQSLSDGGKISGATTTNLVIADVSAAEAGSYHCVATANSLTDTSAAATLTIITPTGEAFENAVIAANAVAYYRLNETADPATNPLAFDYMGGGLGTYGVGSQNGFNAIAGPVPTSGLTGFAAANKAAQFANLTANSRVTASPLNLNTNTVTLTAWVKPTGQQAASAAVIYTRGGGSVAGLAFSAAFDAMGNRTLTYNWNNEWETYSWDSGITPPADQWSFVALVVSPTAATIHVMSPGTLLESTYLYQHEPEAFGGSLLIGDDSLSADGSRAFNGAIDEVAVFNSTLTKAQLVALYTAGVGSVSSYAPTIRMQPASLNLHAGQTAIFRVAGGGSDPLTYQWMAGQQGSGSYNNLVDGPRISGATTSMLVISNVSNADQLDYVVRLSNQQGSVTSTPAASILVMPTSPAEQITMAGVLQPGGADWETPNWSDGNPASVSAAMKPGSTYTLMPSGGNNTRLRTPEQPRTAVFPGSVLMVNGTAVFTNNFGAAGETSEIRFKQPNPGRVIFPKLVMNGGQLDAGNDGIIEIGGLIEIRTNAPFYNDGGNDRGYLITAQLTGTGSIEYRAYTGTAFRSNYVNSLNIAGTNNTFSGKWNVVIGTLLATGPGSLGTNDITVGAAAAFQPTYDVKNTNAVLLLSGRMYLHRDHTFKSVFINGTPLAAGTYTFAELNAAYPDTFPAAWMPMTGATEYRTGSGSLTVLVQPAPTITQQPVSITKYPSETAVFTVGVSGNEPMFFQWRRSNVALQDAGNISGANSNTLTLAGITSADAGSYDVVVTNSIGSVTSVVATLTLLPTGPALDLTFDFGGAPIVQPTGNDWNTANQWSDGKPASLSALANPGSTYRVVPGARLRSPGNASYAEFPGDVLTLEGDGVYSPDGASGTIAEIRFKHANPGTNYFKRLVMNGGQIDSGDNGIMVIAGRMDVLANTPIYTDSAAGQDRPYQIDAFLTGNGSIEFQQFSTSFAGNLNITGTSNTYSGTWNIVQGALLGSGMNSLGTGNITIGVNGALETLYDIMSPYATLALDGKMFLHQNDSFKAVTVSGVSLNPGTYTFAQLNALYPENFPATWPQQLGSTVVTGSGSITVLGNTLPPVNVQFSVSGTGLTLTWPNGILLEADQPTGPWTTNAAATSPFVVPLTQPQKFYRVQTR